MIGCSPVETLLENQHLFTISRTKHCIHCSEQMVGVCLNFGTIAVLMSKRKRRTGDYLISILAFWEMWCCASCVLFTVGVALLGTNSDPLARLNTNCYVDSGLWKEYRLFTTLTMGGMP